MSAPCLLGGVQLSHETLHDKELGNNLLQRYSRFFLERNLVLQQNFCRCNAFKYNLLIRKKRYVVKFFFNGTEKALKRNFIKLD